MNNVTLNPTIKVTEARNKALTVGANEKNVAEHIDNMCEADFTAVLEAAMTLMGTEIGEAMNAYLDGIKRYVAKHDIADVKYEAVIGTKTVSIPITRASEDEIDSETFKKDNGVKVTVEAANPAALKVLSEGEIKVKPAAFRKAVANNEIDSKYLLPKGYKYTLKPIVANNQ